MKRFIAVAILVFIGVATWQVGSKISADAIGMGIGVMFGIMAGIPTALLLLATQRDRSRYYDAPPVQSQAPPVIILNGPGAAIPNSHWIEGSTSNAVDIPARRNWAEVEDW